MGLLDLCPCLGEVELNRVRVIGYTQCRSDDIFSRRRMRRCQGDAFPMTPRAAIFRLALPTLALRLLRDPKPRARICPLVELGEGALENGHASGTVSLAISLELPVEQVPVPGEGQVRPAIGVLHAREAQ